MSTPTNQAQAINAELLAALQGLFEHCSMVHKRWGEGCNQREADAAQNAARAAIAKATQYAPEPRFMYTTGGPYPYQDHPAGMTTHAHHEFAPLSEMLESNLEFPEFCDWLRAAEVGDHITTGGGAAPVFQTWRVS